MTRVRLSAVSLIAGLALILAGCSGLFPIGKVVHNAPPIAPSVLTGTTTDPRELGEAVIEPSVPYHPDRVVVGYTNDAEGRAAHAEVMKLVGKSQGQDVVLDNLWIVTVYLRDDLTVPEAIGLVMMLAKGALDPEKRGRVSGIVFVEPDYIYPPPEPIPGPEPEAVGLSPQVYDPNADLRAFQWGLDAVNAEAAWALGYSGQGVIVAVMDTGIDWAHPDLDGQVIGGIEVRNMTLLSYGNNDTYGHGTHVAGIIAAKNDGRGVVGLAYNAKILDVRIFDPNFIGTVNYLRGVKWAVDNGAKVLSNSWGGTAYSQAIKAAVDYALVRGVVVVVSAGNDTYALWRRPANIPGAIAVAATDPHNRKASFSTEGWWVSVAAPGVRVLSSVPRSQIQAGTGLPLLYDYWDGTSMACPFVSALAALILEKYPSATPYQVKKLLQNTAKDLETPGVDPKTGHGLIQADKALSSPLPANDGASLRVYVSCASAPELLADEWPISTVDITLRKGGRIYGYGQTDIEGWYFIGFPSGPYGFGYGVGLFPVLEPGTYEIIVGGEDATPYVYNWRTANRVTAKTTVTLNPGEAKEIVLRVSTTLKVTLTWYDGGDDTDIDLAVQEFDPQIGDYDWKTPSNPGYWGTFSDDAYGASGIETYELTNVHWFDDFYPLAVRFNGGTPATVVVKVEQNGVVEEYSFTLTTPGDYPANTWPGWWDNRPGPYVY